MANNISTEQAVINQVMASLPEVKSKKEHTLKSGESLWSIAKRELGGKNLSNREIRDYMLLIAKLNNLTTVDKMNELYVNQKIYLPAEIPRISAQNHKERSDLEKSVDSIINILQNDKTVRVKRATPEFLNLFHIFHEKVYPSGFRSSESSVLSFRLDENEKIRDVSMDDLKNINTIHYDYEIDSNGKAEIDIYPERPAEQLGRKDKEALFNEIYKQYESYKKNPIRFY